MEEVFKNGPIKTCGRQLLENLKGHGLHKGDYTASNFLKPAFHKCYSVRS